MVGGIRSALGAVEVAKDIVLFVYGAWGPPNSQGPAELRRQFLVVTSSGLRPAASLVAALAVAANEETTENQSSRQPNAAKHRWRRQLHVEF